MHVLGRAYLKRLIPVVIDFRIGISQLCRYRHVDGRQACRCGSRFLVREALTAASFSLP